MKKHSDNPLKDYFYSNKKNIIHKWDHYFEIYHKHFQRFVGQECVVLEIGVSLGGSLQMWKHYFGKTARIYGVDIQPECKRFEEDQIEIFIGSQSDRDFLRELKSKIPKIDILIDDGGHFMDQQIVSFAELYDHVSDNGIYLCEDTFTSYWPEYNGGWKKRGTFIEFTKNLIDELHAFNDFNNQGRSTEFANNTSSISFYEGVVVIEKRPRELLLAIKTGVKNVYGNQSIPQTDLNIFILKLKLLGAEIPGGYDPKLFYFDEAFLKGLLGNRFIGSDWPKNAYTMIGFKRLTNIENCVKDVIEKQIAGDLIETGVWRGGACVFMRALLDVLGDKEKTVWLADSFEGLPTPDIKQYPHDKGLDLYLQKELAISQEAVKENFAKFNLLDDRVKFLKGWFKITLPEAPIDKLSLLRLDGDLYESTIDALFYLYPLLSPGGFCIVDDWGAIPACRMAVDDYRSVFNIQERMQVIDWTGVFWKKEMEIEVLSREDFMETLKRKE